MTPDRGSSNPLLDAALAYAARGWPVFPCSPKDKRPLLARDVDGEGKPIPNSGGVTKASTDPDQIRAWWKHWPKALVAIATGHPTLDANGRRLFVVDYDPREDPDSGEVWTLERLKGELEEQMGCPAPSTLAAVTPSDGVHQYLLQPDDGEPITNRGNLPEHVDVRGLGGYVIAPPSVMGPNAIKGQSGRRYRWLHGEPDRPLAEAPASLIEILRSRSRPERVKAAASTFSAALGAEIARAETAVDQNVRKYALAALDGECRAIRGSGSGQRNRQLNESALKVASLVATGALDETIARASIEAAARDNPGRDDDRQLIATINSGWTAGLNSPRNLEEIAAAARARAERGPYRPSKASGQGSESRPRHSARPAPGAAEAARPSAPAPDAASRDKSGSFRSGKVESLSVGSEAGRARLQRLAEAWLDRRLAAVGKDKAELTALAWGVGRRVAAELLDENEARERILPKAEAVPGLLFEEIERAIDDGFNRGFDPAPLQLDADCAAYPMTDKGNAMRFRARFGEDFRFTTAKGWLGWDGRRWKVLDQDEKSTPAEIMAAVFDTVDAIQREARLIRETGLQLESWRPYAKPDQEPPPEVSEHGLDRYIPKGSKLMRFSEAIAAWGRASESAGRLGCIGNLAKRWLTVPIEQFDCEPLAINVLNGTLRFRREQLADGAIGASVQLDAHRREDLSTKLAPVEYDPKAECPIYDGQLAWAQPDPAMRRYLHQVGGYAMTGDTTAHALWFWYGRGRNGKSTTIDTWCHFAGDYSGTTLIETFLDQGIKKRGDQASPDLARLGGVRMLRASEPERGAKLNAALIKFVTGGEPVPVRALHRGFFDLLPRFKLVISGNSKPDIPDTDEGIWSRMKLVPWLRNIEQPQEDPLADRYPVPAGQWPKKDPELVNKMKAAEGAGILNRLVAGLMDWLANGLVEPDTVRLATQEYRDQSDPLARFLRLCTAPDPASRIQSSKLHEVFAAWCKAAGEREWTNKGLAKAMADKGYTKKASDGMQWLGLRLVRQASDFVDSDGNVRDTLPDFEALAAREAEARDGEGAAEAPPRTPTDDDNERWNVP
jgi:putative DNA primase/helicase